MVSITYEFKAWWTQGFRNSYGRLYYQLILQKKRISIEVNINIFRTNEQVSSSTSRAKLNFWISTMSPGSFKNHIWEKIVIIFWDDCAFRVLLCKWEFYWETRSWRHLSQYVALCDYRISDASPAITHRMVHHIITRVTCDSFWTISSETSILSTSQVTGNSLRVISFYGL